MKNRHNAPVNVTEKKEEENEEQKLEESQYMKWWLAILQILTPQFFEIILTPIPILSINIHNANNM